MSKIWTPDKVIWGPNPGPQTAFLSSNVRELMYGGATGGGKSDALTVCDLHWIDHPKHRSLMLRRTRPELQESIDRSQILFPVICPGAVWQEARSRWEMPSGAWFQYGYAEHEKDIHKFKTFEYNVIKFDELTTFTEYMYLFMFLRNRKKAKELPLWIRSGTNPGDVGHQFVFDRFIKNKEPYKVYMKETKLPNGNVIHVSQQFIPSRVWDNPQLPDADQYIAGIMQMGEDDVAAYLYGDWTRLAGAMFRTMPEETPPKLRSYNYYLIRTIDYGWEDHTAVYWGVVYGDGEHVSIVRELYVKRCSIDSLAHLIKAHEADLNLGEPVLSIGSPEMGRIEGTSGMSLSSALAMRGVMVTPIKGAQSDRKAGWALVQNWLVGKRVTYWPGACPNLLRTLPVLIRDFPNKPDDLKPRQEDHAADAFRYLLTSVVDPPVRPAASVDPRVGDPNFDQSYDKLIAELTNPKPEFPGF